MLYYTLTLSSVGGAGGGGGGRGEGGGYTVLQYFCDYKNRV